MSSLRWLAHELTNGIWDYADVRKRFEHGVTFLGFGRSPCTRERGP